MCFISTFGLLYTLHTLFDDTWYTDHVSSLSQTDTFTATKKQQHFTLQAGKWAFTLCIFFFYILFISKYGYVPNHWIVVLVFETIWCFVFPQVYQQWCYNSVQQGCQPLKTTDCFMHIKDNGSVVPEDHHTFQKPFMRKFIDYWTIHLFQVGRCLVLILHLENSNSIDSSALRYEL